MKKLLLGILTLYTSTLFAQIVTVHNFSTRSHPPIFGASPFQNGVSCDTSGGTASANGGIGAFDTTTHALIYNGSSHIISSGFNIIGFTGLTTHPHTGEIYAIYKVPSVSGRFLGKFNPLDGYMTEIGNLGDNFSSISFREDGQLFGVTGDGATVPETMYLIDHTNATKVLATAFGAGADGEIIAYNYDDNFFYHWSGNGSVVFEKVMSVAPYTVTNIPIIGTTTGETFGAVYLGGNKFRTSNINSSFNHFFSNGQVTPSFGSLYDDMRGLALVARWISGPTYQVTSLCNGDSIMLQALAMNNDGNTHKYQWVKNGINIPGATSSILYANSSTGGGRYNCRIIIDSLYTNSQTMDSAITVYTDTAWYGRTINFNPSSTINPNPTGYLCNAGDTITLVNSYSGPNQWYVNGLGIVGATNDTLLVTATGLYNVSATLVAGCVDTLFTGTDVQLAPSSTLSNSSNMCFGDSVLLTANTGSTQYNWLLNGTLSITTLANTLYVSANGNYSVETQFGACIDTSSVAPVDFAPQYDVTPSGTGSICSGSNQLLTATSGGSSYQWLSNGTVIGGATSQTFSATTTGIYECIITFPGCTDTTVSQYSLTAVDCSGIEENTTTLISLYPNPAHEKFNITTLNNISIKQIDIVDLNGRKVISVSPNSSNAVIHVEELRSGTYMVTITTENGVKNEKFVKN